MRKMLEMILTKEEMERITEELRDNVPTITVDMHGLKVKEAKRLLSNIMALDRGGMDIQVIHGYIHGNAIKDMVHDGLKNPRMKGRQAVKGNYGRTVLKMKSVA